MLSEIVRCPYCAQGGCFRPMFQQSQGLFLCLGCGHTTAPQEPEAKCDCSRCMAVIQVASRCRNGEEPRRYISADSSLSSCAYDEVTRY